MAGWGADLYDRSGRDIAAYLCLALGAVAAQLAQFLLAGGDKGEQREQEHEGPHVGEEVSDPERERKRTGVTSGGLPALAKVASERKRASAEQEPAGG
jgi:hypothetical protein